MFEAGAERLLDDAVAELAGGCENAQWRAWAACGVPFGFGVGESCSYLDIQ